MSIPSNEAWEFAQLHVKIEGEPGDWWVSLFGEQFECEGVEEAEMAAGNITASMARLLDAYATEKVSRTDPTPAILSDAAREIERALAGDMREAADKIAVMDWMLKYGGEMAGSIDERVYLGIDHFFADIHQAAKWIRQQQEAQDAE